MDGVVTQTMEVHFRSWQRVFDAFLSRSQYASQQPFSMSDYRLYVDGRPRRDGIHSFLNSRGISVEEGEEGDEEPPDTVSGLAAAKDGYFREELRTGGVQVYAGTIEALQAVRTAGLKTALVSSSRHAEAVLKTAGISELFDVRVDGNDIIEMELPGKPDAATFLEGALRLRIGPKRAAVIEDASAGVQAGRAGGFALVIGINREGPAGRLVEAGADFEVGDLGEVELVAGEG